MTQVTVNGNTYSDDGTTAKDMVANGGYRVWFLALVRDFMTDIAAKFSSLAASVAAAAASAASAVTAPGTSATSTTNLTVGYGSKSLTVQAGKTIPPGVPVTIGSAAAPTTVWMHGRVSSYNSGTGALVVDVIALDGLGSVAANWSVGLSGPGGAGLTYNKYTGSQFYDAGVFEGWRDIGAGTVIDLSTGNMFKKTITAGVPWTMDVQGVPAGAGASFTAVLVNPGAAVITPPAGTVYSGGVPPVFTITGKDRIQMVKEPGGVWEMYLLAKDIK